MMPLLLIACGGVASVTPASTTPSGTPLPRYAVDQHLDVAYGPLPEERLDLCQPKGAPGSRPGVLLIHGGGWVGGDKKQFADICSVLAAQGFVVANANYRLAQASLPMTQWPAQLVDVQLAVRWMRAHASQFGFDPQRLCAWGESAGGHLAVFLGVQKTIQPGDEAQLFATESPAVSSVVDDFGPVDLTKYTLRVHAITTLLGGATHQSNPALYREASPIFGVTAQSAPMLIVQGTQDTIVPASQSLELQRALRRHRVPVQYISYQGAHAWQGLTKQQYFNILTQQLAYLSQEYP